MRESAAPAPSPPTFAFDHAAVSVPDLEASIAWYGQMLGFRVLRHFELPHGTAKAAMLYRDGMRIELFEPRRFESLPEARRHPDTDVQLHGNKHVAFRVEDLGALETWFEARGADVALKVTQAFGSALFIRDNCGNLIEFLERPAKGSG